MRMLVAIMIGFTVSTGLCGQPVSNGSSQFVDSLLARAVRTPNAEALALCHAALATAQHIGYEKGRADAYQIVASMCIQLENYDQAFVLLNKSLAISKHRNDSAGIAREYRLLGLAHKRLRNYIVAYGYYTLASEYADTVDPSIQAICSAEMIDVLIRMDSISSARQWLSGLNKILPTLAWGNTYLYARACYYHGYGALLLRMDSLSKASHLLLRAVEVSKKCNEGESRTIIVAAQRNLSEIALRKGNVQAAYQQLSTALRSAKLFGDIAAQRELYEEIADWFERQSKFDIALAFHRRQRTLSEYWNGRKSQRAIHDDLRKKTAVIVNMDNRMEEKTGDDVGLRKHRWQIFAIISFSFVLILLFGKYIDVANRKKRTLISQLGHLESKALKAQMNPHFIFNSLNSIQALIANDNQSEAMLYVSKFSKLLRSVIENSNKNLIPLQSELNNLRFYIELESLRLNFTLDYSIDVDPQICAESEMIPPLIVQPIVENSLWHGLNGKNGIKQLRVRVDVDSTFLKFAVIDNGIGRDAARQSQRKTSTGVGLSNTERRISLLNENMVKDSFWIEDLVSQDGISLGTKVTFKVRRSS
jgi:tetratricopeptide (TPR) repeat protein